MMYAHGSKFRRALIEKFLLTVLAAIGFIDHDFNSHMSGGREYTLHQLTRRRFEQAGVTDARNRVEARILADHVGIEISHKPLNIFRATRNAASHLRMPVTGG